MRLPYSTQYLLLRFNFNLSNTFYINWYQEKLTPQTNLNVPDFYIKNTFVGGSTRSFRYIFGLPVNGQRTWSNAATCFSNSYVTYNLKFNKFNRLTGRPVPSNIFLAEYINLFIQQQWFYEWFAVAQNFMYLPPHTIKGNFIDMQNLLHHNIYTYYNSPFKTKKAKSHRKKRTYPRNKVVTGLPFFFSFIYQKQLKRLKLTK